MNASSGSLYLTRPDLLLRLEGLLELVVGCVAYQRLYPHHWGIFAVLFLAPDISLLGYLRSASKASAVFYNLVHSYVLPLALGLLAWELGSALTGQLALIWLAHISFDRCLGFGLKFPESFRVTHIQRSEAIDLTALSGKT
jgi:predicted ferric reductase